MLRRSVLYTSLWAVVLLCVMGCGDSFPTKVYPVEGRLMIAGKPAGGPNMVFHAIDRRIVSRPVAITESDGSFRLMTYALDDGIPAGEYVVTIFWRDKPIRDEEPEEEDLVKHDRSRALFGTSTKSHLRATVRHGPNDLLIQADQTNPIDSRENPALIMHERAAARILSSCARH